MRKVPVLCAAFDPPGVRYEEYQVSTTGSINIGGVNWHAMMFSPQAGHTVRMPKAQLFKAGAPGTVTMSLRATTGSPAYPTGADLAVGTFDGNGLGGSPGAMTPVAWTGVYLQPGVFYAIVIRCVGASGTLRWIFTDQNVYARGHTASSGNSGSSWNAIVTDDAYFEEWS